MFANLALVQIVLVYPKLHQFQADEVVFEMVFLHLMGILYVWSDILITNHYLFDRCVIVKHTQIVLAK